MRPRLVLLIGTCAVAVLAGCAGPQPTWTPLPEPSPTAGPSGLPSAQPSAGASPSAAASSTPSTSPSPSPATADRPFPGGWTYVKTEACPDGSSFECTTLTVPRDHFVQGGPTWDVTFARRPASGEKKGTFVVITGGPGTSGISVADSYTLEDYPAVFAEHYDMVFIDQRGVGLSHPIQCPNATGVYYLASYDPYGPDGVRKAGEAAKAYVDGCLAEAGADKADLPFYATRQAVDDLEAYLDYLKVDKIHLYGESYGTQYVQQYAASHPDRVETLLLDGPVDLTLPGVDWMAEEARGYDDVLRMTLAGCTLDPACAADFAPATPTAAFDDLRERIADGPIDYQYTGADGSVETRQFTMAMLETTLGTITGPEDRAMFQRDLAAAADDDLVPLARLAYAALVIDPDSEAAIPDPTWSDAMYYAVDCMDYTYFPAVASADERTAEYIEAGRTQGLDRLWMGATYTGELPCMYWPNAATDPARPDPIVTPPYTTFVMGATGDPSTPLANVHRIASRVGNAYSIVADGGHHVIFAWGNDCPDLIIAAYFEDGTLPKAQSTFCDDAIADPYVAVPRPAATDYADALALASAMDDQIVNTPDYFYWEAEKALAIGCDFGGTLTYTPTDTGTDLILTACEFTDGMAMTGTGAIDDETGGLAMKIDIPDGSLDYARDGDGNRSVRGTFRGAPVNLKD